MDALLGNCIALVGGPRGEGGGGGALPTNKNQRWQT